MTRHCNEAMTLRQMYHLWHIHTLQYSNRTRSDGYCLLPLDPFRDLSHDLEAPLDLDGGRITLRPS
jgi:hypothetical protein